MSMPRCQDPVDLPGDPGEPLREAEPAQPGGLGQQCPGGTGQDRSVRRKGDQECRDHRSGDDGSELWRWPGEALAQGPTIWHRHTPENPSPMWARNVAPTLRLELQ